ncbi:MAG TPA: hypothetical protein VFC39_02930 [Acidobacteriaceae bacterium]|nr:hypothetical protein [Acidobacteriaceae bacterium]
MLTVILLFSFLGQFHHGLSVPREHESPGVAATTPNADYPLKVHILGAMRNQDRSGVHGYGSGNLLGPPPVGFDYTYNCEYGFLHNAQAGEFYQGKWKTPDRKIELLTQEMGSNHVDKCTINVTLKSAPYSKENPPPRAPTAR